MNRALLTIGAFITRIVGTMWCAIVFLSIAIVATPGMFPPLTATAQWFAQDVLQLVLLSIIMVGQNLQTRKTETLLQETHDTVMTELAEIRATHTEILTKLGDL